MLGFLRTFIGLLSDLNSIAAKIVPDWAVPILAFVLSGPDFNIGKPNGPTQASVGQAPHSKLPSSGGKSRTKLWVVVVLVVAAATLGLLARTWLPLRPKPKIVLDPVPHPREPGPPILLGCGNRLQYWPEKPDWFFELSSGPCELVIRDAEGEYQPGVYRHAFGVIFYQIGSNLVLPPIGFNLRHDGERSTRVRAQLSRVPRNPKKWCLTVTTADAAMPQSRTVLPIDPRVSTERTDCWEQPAQPTSALMRVEFDGIHFRIVAHFYKDAYERAGRRTKDRGETGIIEYLVPVQEVTSVVAAIGTGDEQPLWRICLTSNDWRVNIVNPQQARE